jgi:hypothetical protein
MPQVNIPNGQIKWQGGAAGSAPVMEFDDTGDPNVRSDPQSLLANCAINSSRYWRQDAPDANHRLYCKTDMASGANPNGVWTAQSGS